MPTYDFRCPDCGVFELRAGYSERSVYCDCGRAAERLPFSGIPYLNGATVASAIPDPTYRQEAEKRDLNRSWGDASRSVEMLRKNVVEQKDGNKVINLAGMRATT